MDGEREKENLNKRQLDAEMQWCPNRSATSRIFAIRVPLGRSNFLFHSLK